MLPTAMSVVSDIVEVGRNLLSGTTGRLPHLAFHADMRSERTLRPHGAISCQHYLRFSVRDMPGVVAGIATVLGDHSISIAQMLQPQAAEGRQVDLVIITHEAREQDVNEAIRHIEKQAAVLATTQHLRIAGEL